MIKLAINLPEKFYVACSGGRDSMSALSFLRNSRNKVGVAFFDHNTQHSRDAKFFVKEHCIENDIECVIGKIDPLKYSKGMSMEAFWSKERNEWFNSLEAPVVTAHHLNDAVEWWIYSSLKGNPSLMGLSNNNVLRPLLITEQKELYFWSEKNNVNYICDPSNDELDYNRNFIRHKMMKDALKVNPGLFKTIKKKYLKHGSKKRKTKY